ncbi:hypothetical protein MASR1M107_11830 [Ignavibacteriales bacterium]
MEMQMPNSLRTILFLIFSLIITTAIAQQSKIVPQNNHSTGVRTAIISPDGKTCITAGFDNLLKIWDYESGLLTGNIKTFPGVVNALAFLSNKSMIAGDSRGFVSLFDFDSKKLLLKRKISTRAINFIEYDKPNNMIWCSGFGGLLVGLDADSLNTMFDMKNLPADINTAVLSSQTNTLFLGSTSGKLYIFNTTLKKITDSSEIFDSDVSGLKIFDSGKVLLASSFNGELKFFDIDQNGTPKQNRVIANKAVSMITSLSASPSGLYAAATTLENQILLVNIKEKSVYKSFNAHEYTLSQFLFKNDNEGVSFSFGYRSLVWDLNNTNAEKREFNGHQGKITHFVSGKDFIVYATSDNEVKKISLNESFKQVNVYQGIVAVTALALENDSKKIAIGNQDGEICVIDLITGEIDFMQKVHDKEILSIDFTKDFLISSGAERQLKIIPVKSLGSAQPITSDLKARFTTVGYSHELKLIVAGTYDGLIYLIDPFTGKKESTFTGHSGAVNSVETGGKKGEFLVSTSDDRTTRIWNTDQLFNFRTYQNENGIVSSAIFNFDGTVLTTGDGGFLSSINIQNVTTSQFEESDFNLYELSSVGKSHVAAMTATGLLQFWDKTNGKLKYILFPQGEETAILSLSTNEVFSTGNNKTLFITAGTKKSESENILIKKSLDNFKLIL